MLRPVEEADLPLLLRLYTVDGAPYAVVPDLSLGALRERWTRDRHCGDADGKLVVDDGQAVGVVSWTARRHFTTAESRCWNVGIQPNPRRPCDQLALNRVMTRFSASPRGARRG